MPNNFTYVYCFQWIAHTPGGKKKKKRSRSSCESSHRELEEPPRVLHSLAPVESFKCTSRRAFFFFPTTCKSRKQDTFSQGTGRQQPLTERQLPKGPAWDAHDFIYILISVIQLTACRLSPASSPWPTEGPRVELPRAG